jgi:hypothetical protein
MTAMLDKIRQWFGRGKEDAKENAEGGEPVATPSAESQRETSTNAQTAGAAEEPWPGNE